MTNEMLLLFATISGIVALIIGGRFVFSWMIKTTDILRELQEINKKLNNF